MQIIFDNFYPKSFCHGLIEWADSQSFCHLWSKPIWERGSENVLVFEDQKMADTILDKIKENLPQENSYGRLSGVDDYLRLYRFGRGFQLFNPEDLTRSKKEKIFYRVLIFLNGSIKQKTLSLDNSNLEIKAGSALLCSNPCHLNLENSEHLYLLMADVLYRK
jgi:hypothetical protein